MRDLIKEKVLETKKSLVLQKVSEYFDKEGFESVKMQDIAENLRISVGALYKLFPSKDDLFFEYIAYQISDFHARLMHICSGIDDPRTLLEKFVDLKFSTFTSKRKAIEDPVIGDPLFFLKMNTQKSDPAEPIYSFLADTFLKLSKIEPLREKDEMKTAYLFNAYTMGYIEYWLKEGGELNEDPKEVVERFVSGMKVEK